MFGKPSFPTPTPRVGALPFIDRAGRKATLIVTLRNAYSVAGLPGVTEAIVAEIREAGPDLAIWRLD